MFDLLFKFLGANIYNYQHKILLTNTFSQGLVFSDFFWSQYRSEEISPSMSVIVPDKGTCIWKQSENTRGYGENRWGENGLG